MDIRKIEDLEFEIYVLKQELKESKNEENKQEIKRELKKIKRKYQKMIGDQNV